LSKKSIIFAAKFYADKGRTKAVKTVKSLRPNSYPLNKNQSVKHCYSIRNER